MADLSASERAVFELVRQGLSNKEIASARGRSVATIRGQLQAVFEKTGIHSRGRLIVWAHQPANQFGP